MINLKNLNFHLDNLNETNRCLNEEEKMGILCGMTQLEKSTEKEIYFWGKIEGTEKDYYITYYFDYENVFPEKVFFYCTDNYEFKEIKRGNDTNIKKLEREMPQTLFKGIPTYPYSIQNASLKQRKKELEKEKEESEEPEESEKENTDKEEDEEEEEKKKRKEKKKEIEESKEKPILEIERLSYVIRKIDKEAFIIPYNSIKVTNNLEIKFTTFNGFNLLDAMKLSSWAHFRYPRNFTLGKIDNYNSFFLNNFLDSIKSDIPKEMWNIKINDELSKISIINYLYPGFVFYHILNTPFYASLYIGNGIPNMDLPFLLP